MPGKGTGTNVWKLFNIIAYSVTLHTSGVIASTDAEKAFDSVDCEYLWMILWRFGFCPQFISWKQLLYTYHTAHSHWIYLSWLLRLSSDPLQWSGELQYVPVKKKICSMHQSCWCQLWRLLTHLVAIQALKSIGTNQCCSFWPLSFSAYHWCPS